MSKEIVYDGNADVQTFNKADFAKEGVDQGKLSFNKGEVVEVDDSVAEVLLGGQGVFADFGFREPKKGDAGYQEGEAPAAASSSKKSNEQAGKEVPDNDGAAAQEDTGGAAAPATAGTGGATGVTGATGTTGTTAGPTP